jgi:regulator of nucleoside diphosphate kinase
MSNIERDQYEQRPAIVLTSTDRDALLALLGEPSMTTDVAAARFLLAEIERADITSDYVAPNSMVRIGCHVKFVDHADARVRRAQIVFPEDSISSDRISVLSRIGSALIGLGPGQSVHWNEYGKERSLAVLEVSATPSIIPPLPLRPHATRRAPRPM